MYICVSGHVLRSWQSSGFSQWPQPEVLHLKSIADQGLAPLTLQLGASSRLSSSQPFGMKRTQTDPHAFESLWSRNHRDGFLLGQCHSSEGRTVGGGPPALHQPSPLRMACLSRKENLEAGRGESEVSPVP